jgi:hypothetical protein
MRRVPVRQQAVGRLWPQHLAQDQESQACQPGQVVTVFPGGNSLQSSNSLATGAQLDPKATT